MSALRLLYTCCSYLLPSRKVQILTQRERVGEEVAALKHVGSYCCIHAALHYMLTSTRVQILTQRALARRLLHSSMSARTAIYMLHCTYLLTSTRVQILTQRALARRLLCSDMSSHKLYETTIYTCCTYLLTSTKVQILTQREFAKWLLHSSMRP